MWWWVLTRPGVTRQPCGRQRAAWRRAARSAAAPTAVTIPSVMATQPPAISRWSSSHVATSTASRTSRSTPMSGASVGAAPGAAATRHRALQRNVPVQSCAVVVAQGRACPAASTVGPSSRSVPVQADVGRPRPSRTARHGARRRPRDTASAREGAGPAPPAPRRAVHARPGGSAFEVPQIGRAWPRWSAAPARSTSQRRPGRLARRRSSSRARDVATSSARGQRRLGAGRTVGGGGGPGVGTDRRHVVAVAGVRGHPHQHHHQRAHQATAPASPHARRGRRPRPLGAQRVRQSRGRLAHCVGRGAQGGLGDRLRPASRGSP